MADAEGTSPTGPASAPWVRRALDPTSGLAWIVGGLLVLAQVTLWILATPVYGGPDEPAHTHWAAAVAGGDVNGRPTPDGQPGRVVEVPASIAGLSDPACFASHPEVPAGCISPHTVTGDSPVEVVTRAGRYPPAYYAVAGLPLRADAGLASFYGARLLSAVLVVGLLTLGLWAVRHRWDAHLGIGVTLALTPMVVFVFAIINPNALEVAGAAVLWLAGAALVRSREGDPIRRLTAVAAVGAVALALSRPASALWVGLVGAALLLVVRREAWSRLVRTRAWWGALTAAAVATAFSVVWLFGSGFFSGATTGEPSGLPSAFRSAFIETFLRTDDYTDQLFGFFGWLSTPAPNVVPILWLLLVGALLVLGLTSGRRFALAIVGIGVAVAVVPAVLEARVLGTEGFIWQGRYTLPLAVGLPLLAAVAVQERPALSGPRLRSVLAWTLVFAWVAHVISYAGTLRRFVVGIAGPYPGLSGGGWSPPVDGRVLTLGLAVATGAFAWWIWSTTSAVDRSAV